MLDKTITPKSSLAETDTLARDILDLIAESVVKAKNPIEAVIDTDKLIMALCSYIVRRDHIVHNEAMTRLRKGA